MRIVAHAPIPKPPATGTELERLSTYLSARIRRSVLETYDSYDWRISRDTDARMTQHINNMCNEYVHALLSRPRTLINALADMDARNHARSLRRVAAIRSRILELFGRPYSTPLGNVPASDKVPTPVLVIGHAVGVLICERCGEEITHNELPLELIVQDRRITVHAESCVDESEQYETEVTY